MRSHDKDMDFWDTACLITASNKKTMNHNNCRYLEAMLIRQAIEAKRAIIYNTQKPSLDLESMDKQTSENFIHYLNLVLPIININFLNPLRATDKTIKHPMFELIHESRTNILIKAFANQVDGDFFILKGSCASVEPRREHQTPKNTSIRKELLDDKTLKENDDKKTFIFTKDIKFSSASAAASVVLNGHAGVREWKIRGTEEKKDYSEWRNNPQAFTANFL